jgi:hypothetical protein
VLKVPLSGSAFVSSLYVDVASDRLYVAMGNGGGIGVYNGASTMSGDASAIRNFDRTFQFNDAPANASYPAVLVDAPNNFVYAADANNHRVMSYNPADTASGSLAATHIITDAAANALQPSAFAHFSSDSLIVYGPNVYIFNNAKSASGNATYAKKAAGGGGDDGIGYVP